MRPSKVGLGISIFAPTILSDGDFSSVDASNFCAPCCTCQNDIKRFCAFKNVFQEFDADHLKESSIFNNIVRYFIN